MSLDTPSGRFTFLQPAHREASDLAFDLCTRKQHNASHILLARIPLLVATCSLPVAMYNERLPNPLLIRFN